LFNWPISGDYSWLGRGARKSPNKEPLGIAGEKFCKPDALPVTQSLKSTELISIKFKNDTDICTVPVFVMENKSSWLRVDDTDEHAISGAVGGHFSHFTAGLRGVGQVQFMTSSVYCQAVVHRCNIISLFIIIIIITVTVCGIH